MHRFIVFIVLFCFGHIAQCQHNNEVFFNYHPQNSKYPDGFLMETFSQQKDGTLWLGSRNGLTRFDGFHFHTFTSNVYDTTGISGNYIATQYIEKNQLFAGTYSSGFFVMNLKTLKSKRLKLIDSSTGNNFSATLIHPEGDDSIWISTNKESLIKIHKSNFGNRKVSLYPAVDSTVKKFTAIYKMDDAKHVAESSWLLDRSAVILMNKKTGVYNSYQFYFTDKNFQQNSIDELNNWHFEGDSVMWITSFNYGLLKWNYKTGQYQLFPFNLPSKGEKVLNQFNGILAKTAHEYWIASSANGLLLFNTKSNQYTQYLSDEKSKVGLPEGAARAIFKDRHGGLWIAMGNSLAYWNPHYQNVSKEPLRDQFAGFRITNMQMLNNELLFMGAEAGGGNALLNTKKNSLTKLAIPNLPQSVEETSDIRYVTKLNDRWLYKPFIPAFYELNKQQQFSIANIIQNKQIISQYDLGCVAASGDELVFTGEDGVVVFNTNTATYQKHSRAKHSDSLHTAYYFKPITDKNGKVWMASFFGVSVYDPKKKTFTQLSYQISKELDGLQYVTDIKMTKNLKTIFLSTQEKGIFVFDADSLKLKKQYNQQNGLLPQNSILKMELSNNDQMLWASGIKAVMRISLKNNLLNVWDASNSAFKPGFRSYGFAVSENGDVFVADTALYKFTSTATTPIIIKPYVSSYFANKQYMPGDSIIYVDKETSFIQLNVSTGWYADPEHLKLMYQVGKSQDWNLVENGKIILPVLENGITKLRLKSILQGVLVSEGYSEISIDRALFFYQTNGFRIAWISILLTAILLFFRYRISQVRKKERDKAQLQQKINELEIASLRSQMNPHFIFNTLSSLRYLVMTGDNKKASSFILKLSKLLRMILNHSREETVLLQDELDALQLYMEIESLRFENGFSYKMNVNENIDLFDVRIPPLLLQPYVENAIKHGLVNSNLSEKWVSVTVSKVEDHQLLFSINDNGIGRSNAQSLHANLQHHSVGTAITEQRIQLFNKLGNAQISISISDMYQNEDNPGTVVQILYNYPQKSATQ